MYKKYGTIGTIGTLYIYILYKIDIYIYICIKVTLLTRFFVPKSVPLCTIFYREPEKHFFSVQEKILLIKQ
jgi:hypothetical protein